MEEHSSQKESRYLFRMSGQIICPDKNTVGEEVLGLAGEGMKTASYYRCTILIHGTVRKL